MISRDELKAGMNLCRPCCRLNTSGEIPAEQHGEGQHGQHDTAEDRVLTSCLPQDVNLQSPLHVRQNPGHTAPQRSVGAKQQDVDKHAST